MTTLAGEGASRARMSWTSIAYSEPDAEILIKLPDKKFPVPFQIDKDPSSTRQYPTLRTIIPSRLYEMAQPPHSMSKHEQEEIKRFFIYNTSKLKYVLPPMEVLGNLMCVPFYVIQAFQQVHPCKLSVTLIQGSLVVKQECGEQVWCDGCSTIAAALGSAWNVSTTSRHIVQLLSTYASYIDYPEEWSYIILEAETFKFPKMPHTCHPNCVYNRKHL
jgi:hypothetical protein